MLWKSPAKINKVEGNFSNLFVTFDHLISFWKPKMRRRRRQLRRPSYKTIPETDKVNDWSRGECLWQIRIFLIRATTPSSVYVAASLTHGHVSVSLFSVLPEMTLPIRRILIKARWKPSSSLSRRQHCCCCVVFLHTSLLALDDGLFKDQLAWNGPFSGSLFCRKLTSNYIVILRHKIVSLKQWNYNYNLNP